MLRPIIHRVTLTALLLAALLGAGAIIDAGAGSQVATAATTDTAPAPLEAAAQLDNAAAASTGQRGPDRRWPFFSFRNTPGKRSW